MEGKEKGREGRKSEVQEVQEEENGRQVGGEGGGGGGEVGWDRTRIGNGDGIRKVVRILGSKLTVSPPVSPSVLIGGRVGAQLSLPQSPRRVLCLYLCSMAHDWLKRAAYAASPTLDHGVIGPCSIPRLMIW